MEGSTSCRAKSHPQTIKPKLVKYVQNTKLQPSPFPDVSDGYGLILIRVITMDVKVIFCLCVALMLGGANLKVEQIKVQAFEARNVEFVIHSVVSSMK